MSTAERRNRRSILILSGVAVIMLGVGFSSKILYDTFCKVTGYGGTTRQAEVNNSEVIDRSITVTFDANTAPDLPWSFKPEQPSITLRIGENGLAYYKVKNLSDVPVVGTATYNVTPIKAAPYFIKTQCFCFTEQRIEPGQEVSMPVLFHVDAQLDEERRLDDIKGITLSYTFFRKEKPEQEGSALRREILN